MFLCKFGQNPLTGSEDNARKRSCIDAGTDADMIHSKTNMPPWIGGRGLNINLLIYVNLKSVLMAYLLINSEYDQEMPQSQTADNPVAPRGRATQPSRDTRKTN